MPERPPVSLDDRYRLDSGKVFLTGPQALIRLLLEQSRRDRHAGLNTAGFVSGYRGSPLGGFDMALWNATEILEREHIRFQPGLNEEAAATAVWGCQQTDLFGGAKYDGVFGLWYGKNPGVDRAGDAFKHANVNGTSRHGGVLAVSGDDPGATSSTIANQCEQAFMSFLMPVLNPANLEDVLRLGLLGFAMSRYSGVWIGFKAVADTIETTASVMIDPSIGEFQLPGDHVYRADEIYARWPDDRWRQDRRLQELKLPAALAFAGANQVDRMVIGGAKRRIGIVTAGKAYLDVRQALSELGVTPDVAAEIGLCVYKLGLVWPLEAEGLQSFAEGLEEVLVVEERRSFVESQIKDIAYNWDAGRRPRIIGKLDEAGATLIPSTGETSPTMLALVIGRRLLKFGDHRIVEENLARLEAGQRQAVAAASAPPRIPHFCPGCPHNRGTVVPEGSLAMAGIGCHSLAMWMPGSNTMTISHMGGEGVNWIGAAPFVEPEHIIQNMGDGTYAHSGILAVRAAVAAGCRMTFKILYNDAVAMTGGQPVEGHPTVPAIAHQIHAEGVAKIAVVADDSEKNYLPAMFPADVTLHSRREMDAVMKSCRDWPGVSVLIYDQVCATEGRRRRKRGMLPPVDARVVINERVCEACGDCSVQSGCVAIRSVQTPFGIKRRIEQSSCNSDLSCLEGFCPALVTVEGGRLRKPAPMADKDVSSQAIAEPPGQVLSAPYDILIAGVGGTGLITVGALLGMAAHVEGLECTVLDNTGLARMGGAVTTHVRLAPKGADLFAPRISEAGADLLIGGDPIVCASAEVLSRVNDERSRAVLNTHVAPLAENARDPEYSPDIEDLTAAIVDRLGDEDPEFIDATGLAAALLGDTIHANVLALGVAYQKGFVPLSGSAIRRAIEMNGTAVEANLQAFEWGRRFAVDGEAVMGAAGIEEQAEETLDQKIRSRAEFLSDYQDSAHAARYLGLVDRVRARAGEISGNPGGLTEAVAAYYFKLLAPKDEYEVARLYSDGVFDAEIAAMFEGDYRIKYHIGRNWVSSGGHETGRPEKRSFGPWFKYLFRILARIRRVRGTPLDIFKYSSDRKRDRRLVREYEAVIDNLLDGLSPENMDLAQQIARIPENIRGFGTIKDQSIDAAKIQESELLDRYRNLPAGREVN